MKIDWWWLFFDIIARLLPAPPHPVVKIGEPLEKDTTSFSFHPPKGELAFEGCEHARLFFDGGHIMLGVRDGRVLGVCYDLEIYRGSGTKRMRKLQFLLQQHARPHRMRRLVDNGSSMIYRSERASLFAVYAYLSDVLFIHSTATKLKRVK